MDNNQTQTSKSFYIKHGLYLIFSIAVAVVFTFIQTDLLYFHYETDIFLFSAETNTPVILYPILVACIVFIATALISLRKETFPAQITESKNVTIFLSVFCGLVFLMYFGYHMYQFVIDIDNFVMSAHSTLGLAASVFAAPASVYFFILALKKNPFIKATTPFGLCVVLWAILNLMSEYFYMNSPLNDPVRIIHQISYIAIMLFYLYDAGYFAEIYNPVLYQVYGYSAIILISLSSIPAIILSLSNLKPLSIDMMSCYVEFCLLLFVICRMISISIGAKNQPSNDVIGEDTDTDEK
jgi:hypothetical protein